MSTTEDETSSSEHDDDDDDVVTSMKTRQRRARCPFRRYTAFASRAPPGTITIVTLRKLLLPEGCDEDASHGWQRNLNQRLFAFPWQLVQLELLRVLHFGVFVFFGSRCGARCGESTGRQLLLCFELVHRRQDAQFSGWLRLGRKGSRAGYANQQCQH